MAGELVEHCLLIAPHPDDETIGAGVWMDRNRSRDITVLHITDGSPRDAAQARSAGLATRDAYAVARRRELEAALAKIGIKSGQLRTFGYVDQESHLHLRELIARLTAVVEELRPALVLSPAYEGGHPDHDTAALAAACIRRRMSRPFHHQEYCLYHAGSDGRMITGAFLPSEGNRVSQYLLSPDEQQKKREMLDCFATQQHILKEFAVTHESFRDAPDYDFTQPPHSGKLMYEHWGWPLSGSDWRRAARRILHEYSPESMVVHQD